MRPARLPAGALGHDRRRGRPGADRGRGRVPGGCRHPVRGKRGDSGMRVAVTGGCGFIGSHVVDHLLRAGHDVLVIDSPGCGGTRRPSTGRPTCSTPRRWTRRSTGADAVFHLAGAADVNEVGADPVRAVRLNVEGIARILDAARRAGRRPGACSPAPCGCTGRPSGQGERTEDAPVDLRRAGPRVRLHQAGRRAARAQLPGDVRPALHDPALRHPLRAADARRAGGGPVRPGGPGRPADHHRRAPATSSATTSTSRTWPTRTSGPWPRPRPTRRWRWRAGPRSRSARSPTPSAAWSARCRSSTRPRAPPTTRA